MAEVVLPNLGRRRFLAAWTMMTLGLFLVAALSLGIGRYGVPPAQVLGIVLSWLVPIEPFWSETQERVVSLVRAPRIAMAILAGAGLAMAGAALQGTFRNPLVAPHIIGVSSGAAFGGALALLLFNSSLLVVAFAFVFGLVAVTIVFAISRSAGTSNVLSLVLGGIVTGAFFSALVSLITFVADPYDKLPSIVFWLMGSFSAATYSKVGLMIVPVVLGMAILFLLRWRINVLSLGDEEAQTLGVAVDRTRWLVILAVTAITAGVVAVAGVVGWVGLVIPHLTRMIVGSDHRVLLPASALVGAAYLLLVDDLARAATAAEIPLGILTAVIGAPVFAWLLRSRQQEGWARA